MAVPLPQKISAEDYLAQERAAFHRSEFWHGRVSAMAGATENHELICSNLSRFLQNRLGSAACRVFSGSMKVGATKKQGLAYPDLTIVCGARLFFDTVRDVLVNPTIIFEVLSDSTREFDQTVKWDEYQKLESLRHYVLVEQKKRQVRHYERAGPSEPGRWSFEVISAPNAALNLRAAEVELPLDEIYWEIAFPELPDEE
ncbi:MAG: Uma2 family endonuclease [Bryobacteraceae bacterium]|nr:Uma2 family endonuclease [Bryobacteraceae bacterium]